MVSCGSLLLFSLSSLPLLCSDRCWRCILVVDLCKLKALTNDPLVEDLQTTATNDRRRRSDGFRNIGATRIILVEEKLRFFSYRKNGNALYTAACCEEG